MKIFASTFISLFLLFNLNSCSQAQTKTHNTQKHSQFSPPTAPPPSPSGKPSLLKKEPIQCSIEGHSFSWEAGYCLWVSNSKTIYDKAAQKCMNTPRKKVHLLSECEKRVYFKQKMCRHAIKLGYINMGYHLCMKNKEFDKTWPKKQ